MLFDLVVLGTDPAGLGVARLAVEKGHRTALVNDPEHFGTSEVLRPGSEAGPTVRVLHGSARFETPDTLEIQGPKEILSLTARRFVLACGNRPKRPWHLPFDGERILDSDEAEACKQLPEPLLIVGSGESGLRCAADLLERGLRVSLVDQSPRACQEGIRQGPKSLFRAFQDGRCPVQWGTTVLGVENRRSMVTVYYNNGAIESYGGVVFAVGRVGCTAHLSLPRPDLLLDETSRVWCDETGRTGLPHIFAAGSVVGFPRFQGTPAQEAERLISHLFAESIPPKPAFLRMERLVRR